MNSKEKYKQEQSFLETSPDKILDSIKEKINLENVKEWQIKAIVGILERGNVNSAVGKMSELFDLEDKELEHLKKLPAEVIKKIFVKEKKEESVSEEN